MRRVPPLPDLGQLTTAQKDELIVSLWQTLLALETAEAQPATEGKAPVLQDLRSRIGLAAPSRRAWTPRKGEGVAC